MTSVEMVNQLKKYFIEKFGGEGKLGKTLTELKFKEPNDNNRGNLIASFMLHATISFKPEDRVNLEKNVNNIFKFENGVAYRKSNENQVTPGITEEDVREIVEQSLQELRSQKPIIEPSDQNENRGLMIANFLLKLADTLKNKRFFNRVNSNICEILRPDFNRVTAQTLEDIVNRIITTLNYDNSENS